MVLAEGDNVHRVVAFDTAARGLFGGISATRMNDVLLSNADLATTIVSAIVGAKLIVSLTARERASTVRRVSIFTY